MAEVVACCRAGHRSRESPLDPWWKEGQGQTFRDGSCIRVDIWCVASVLPWLADPERRAGIGRPKCASASSSTSAGECGYVDTVSCR